MKKFEENDPVWVKISTYGPWWPGQVVEQDETSGSSRRVQPIATVKFLSDDAYFEVKSVKKIKPFDCQESKDLIAAGRKYYSCESDIRRMQFEKDLAVAESSQSGIMDDPDSEQAVADVECDGGQSGIMDDPDSEQAVADVECDGGQSSIMDYQDSEQAVADVECDGGQSGIMDDQDSEQAVADVECDGGHIDDNTVLESSNCGNDLSFECPKHSMELPTDDSVAVQSNVSEGKMSDSGSHHESLDDSGLGSSQFQDVSEVSASANCNISAGMPAFADVGKETVSETKASAEGELVGTDMNEVIIEGEKHGDATKCSSVKLNDSCADADDGMVDSISTAATDASMDVDEPGDGNSCGDDLCRKTSSVEHNQEEITKTFSSNPVCCNPSPVCKNRSFEHITTNNAMSVYDTGNKIFDGDDLHVDTTSDEDNPCGVAECFAMNTKCSSGSCTVSENRLDEPSLADTTLAVDEPDLHKENSALVKTTTCEDSPNEALENISIETDGSQTCTVKEDALGEQTSGVVGLTELKSCDLSGKADNLESPADSGDQEPFNHPTAENNSEENSIEMTGSQNRGNKRRHSAVTSVQVSPRRSSRVTAIPHRYDIYDHSPTRRSKNDATTSSGNAEASINSTSANDSKKVSEKVTRKTRTQSASAKNLANNTCANSKTENEEMETKKPRRKATPAKRSDKSNTVSCGTEKLEKVPKKTRMKSSSAKIAVGHSENSSTVSSQGQTTRERKVSGNSGGSVKKGRKRATTLPVPNALPDSSNGTGAKKDKGKVDIEDQISDIPLATLSPPASTESSPNPLPVSSIDALIASLKTPSKLGRCQTARGKGSSPVRNNKRKSNETSIPECVSASNGRVPKRGRFKGDSEGRDHSPEMGFGPVGPLPSKDDRSQLLVEKSKSNGRGPRVPKRERFKGESEVRDHSPGMGFGPVGPLPSKDDRSKLLAEKSKSNGRGPRKRGFKEYTEVRDVSPEMDVSPVGPVSFNDDKSQLLAVSNSTDPPAKCSAKASESTPMNGEDSSPIDELLEKLKTPSKLQKKPTDLPVSTQETNTAAKPATKTRKPAGKKRGKKVKGGKGSKKTKASVYDGLLEDLDAPSPSEQEPISADDAACPVEEGAAPEKGPSVPFDPNIDLSVDEASSDDNDEDDDEDLPEAFSNTVSPAKTYAPLFRGDFVWVKWQKFPFWPCIIRRVYSKKRRIHSLSILFVSELMSKDQKGIKVKYKTKSVQTYSSELRQSIIEQGRSSPYSETFEDALSKVEDYLTRKGLGLTKLSSLEYFAAGDETLLEDDDEDDAPMELDQSVTPSKAVDEENMEEESDEEADENPVQEDTPLMKTVSETQNKRREKNKALVEFIQTEKVKEHLLKIYNGTKKSSLHDDFKNNPYENRLIGFGPIGDDDQICEIMETMASWYKEVDKASRCGNVRYIQYVWIPEAIVFAMKALHGYGPKRAWEQFHKGVKLNKAERESLHQDMIQNASPEAMKIRRQRIQEGFLVH